VQKFLRINNFSLRIGLFFIGFVLLSGCGSPSVSVGFDSSVPASQQAVMRADFQRISTLNITQPQPGDAQILGTSDLSASTLVTWLNAQIRVVVGANYDWQSQANVAGGGSGDFTSDTTNGDDAQTLMLNLGAYIYIQEKPQNQVYTLQTSQGAIVDNSPTVGLVQVDALTDSTQLIQGSAINSFANQAIRIPVYYHEGTHDFGGGLPHALCPSGVYADEYACELYSNGPYGVEAMLLRNLYSLCATCTSNEQYALSLVVADKQSRILPGATFVKKTTESIQ
jgi:hypothetical protein